MELIPLRLTSIFFSATMTTLPGLQDFRWRVDVTINTRSVCALLFWTFHLEIALRTEECWVGVTVLPWGCRVGCLGHWGLRINPTAGTLHVQRIVGERLP